MRKYLTCLVGFTETEKYEFDYIHFTEITILFETIKYIGLDINDHVIKYVFNDKYLTQDTIRRYITEFLCLDFFGSRDLIFVLYHEKTIIDFQSIMDKRYLLDEEFLKITEKVRILLFGKLIKNGLQ